MIFHCVQCRRLHGRLLEQKMADLPYCRVAETPPFTFCGVDMFDPFIIKQRRSQVKRYGAMFTCMSCQAVLYHGSSPPPLPNFREDLKMSDENNWGEGGGDLSKKLNWSGGYEPQ